MQFMLLIYIDGELVEELPDGQLDGMLGDCFDHVDDLARQGTVLESHMLVEASQARTLRTRKGHPRVLDGPFSETAEQVVGFYLVESGDEADLRAVCQRFAARGEHIEFRRMAE